ncbi:hypothetical protein D4R89_02495 [bacterium]|nr:MAG: hypothetical protein D4R89_02495 [bacterium]
MSLSLFIPGRGGFFMGIRHTYTIIKNPKTKACRGMSKMSNIKFNLTTKEIEIKGSESFIESNFYQIKALLIESFGEKKAKVSRQTMAGKESLLSDENSEPITEVLRTSEMPEAPEELPATKPEIHEVPQAPRVARPPVRKYFNTLGKCIRSEDTSINKSQPVNVLGQIPEELSVASLKEKFGLSEKQIEEIIKDAEKQGRVRKDLDGSYVWV